MPKRKLTDSERRRLTLASFSGAPFSSLANEYGVSRAYVYRLRDDALTRAEDEGAFWDEVRRLAAKPEEEN